jgi:hypothetical protein
VKVTSEIIPEPKDFLFGLIPSEKEVFRTWVSEKKEGISFESPPEEREQKSEPQKLEKPISELERLQSQHRDILEKLGRLNSELASLVSINPLKAGEIQALLDGDTILIEYFIGTENRFIFVVTKEKVLAVPWR